MDPKEEHGVMVQMLWAWVPFDDIARMHNELIEKYPHREPYRSVLEEELALRMHGGAGTK